MKHQTFVTSILTILLVSVLLLGGCTNTAKESKETKNTPVDATYTGEASTAYESGEEISAEELARLEKEKIDEIKQQYTIYSEYGLTYDEDKDRFFFEKQMVRYFSDQISETHTNAFFYKEGVIDLSPIRNSDNKLTGLQKASQDEFTARTKRQNELEEEMNSVIGAEATQSYEVGDSSSQDSSLTPYASYGIYMDEKSSTWMYEERPIRIFYDKDRMTYANGAVTDGVNLIVTRAAKGEIEKISEMSDEDISSIVK